MTAYIYVRNARRAGLVRRLAGRLGIRVVDGTQMPRLRDGNALICWGNSTPPAWDRPRGFFWLGNTPEHVAGASNKLRALRTLTDAGVPTLEYTTNRNTAIDWLQNGAGVYARTVLTGHSAAGLIYLDHRQRPLPEVPVAPLYTKDFGTPFKEYRVHVAFGRVIDITQKRRLTPEEIAARGDAIPADRERLQVRTYGNGWIFSRQGIDGHEDINNLGIQAAAALGNMAMAAVDIVVHWRRGVIVDMAVMEVNTAPALRSDTLLDAYVEAFRPHINARGPVDFRPLRADLVPPPIEDERVDVDRRVLRPDPPLAIAAAAANEAQAQLNRERELHQRDLENVRLGIAEGRAVLQAEIDAVALPPPVIRKRDVNRAEILNNGVTRMWIDEFEYVDVVVEQTRLGAV